MEEFDQKTFVIFLSGELIEVQNSRLIEDLVLLQHIDINIVLVHGAELQIRNLYASEGLNYHTEDGIFVAQEKYMPLIEQAVSSANWKLLSRIKSCASKMQAFTGHFLLAEKKTFLNNYDSHFTGSVYDIELETLRQAASDSKLAIVPPFSLGEKGHLWILDPIQVAFEVATRLRAKKLIVLDTFPLPNFGNTDSFEITTDCISKWLEKEPEMPSAQKIQLSALTEACVRGVERCHLLDGSIEGVLLAELLTPKGAGIMITNSSYKRIRPARLNDLQSIIGNLSGSTQHSAIVSRTPEYIERQIDNYIVYCVDEDVVGCCEIIQYADGSAAEIASLTVDKSYRNQGIGSELVRECVKEMISCDVRLIFALSTAVSHIFTQCGFEKISPEELPDEKRKNYEFQESIVYGRRLD